MLYQKNVLRKKENGFVHRYDGSRLTGGRSLRNIVKAEMK